MKKVLFISSTGGHLSELLQLKSLFSKCDFTIVSEKTKSNLSLKDKYPDKVHFLKYGTKHNLLLYLFIFPYNCLVSLYLFLKLKPDVVVSTGAHTAVPMCYLAHFFKKKIIYIETFANIHTKTLSGKLVYPIADHFIVQWQSMLELYPKAEYGGWIF
ncbi:MAG: PssD/Cps14F family polysaccharide biosynthesis glycosyltransferase [Erysipelotrichaceae bacterium]